MLNNSIKQIGQMFRMGSKRWFSSDITRSMSDEIIGIDLGTTNSCVAVAQRSGVIVIENSEGKRTTPSSVAFSKEGDPIVGQAARNQVILNFDRYIYAFYQSWIILGCSESRKHILCNKKTYWKEI